MDLLKAFDIINDDLLIAKLKTLGFSFNTLSHIYLQNNMRKLEKITHSVEEILADVPKSSILGPLLFIILRNKISFFDNRPSTNLTDLITPSTMFSFFVFGLDLDGVKGNLDQDLLKLCEWFCENCIFKA